MVEIAQLQENIAGKSPSVHITRIIDDYTVSPADLHFTKNQIVFRASSKTDNAFFEFPSIEVLLFDDKCVLFTSPIWRILEILNNQLRFDGSTVFRIF